MSAMRESPGDAVRCPSCGKAEYFVFRRLPAGEGKVHNLCRCRSCDGSFSCEEDRLGKVTGVQKA